MWMVNRGFGECVSAWTALSCGTVVPPGNHSAPQGVSACLRGSKGQQRVFSSGGARVTNKGPVLSITYVLDGGGVKLPGSYLGTSQQQAAVGPIWPPSKQTEDRSLTLDNKEDNRTPRMEPKEYLKPVEKVRRVPNIYHSPTFGVPMWAGRPQPPLTRFARDVRAFLRGKGTGGTGRVEEAYPVGVARARETEHVTVDAIRRVGTGAIGEEDGCWQALVRFQPRKTSERDDQSVFQSLGLEVGQELRGGTVVSSVVSVVEGGLLSQWSVAPGMEVIDDGGKGHVTIAMETPFRPVGDFSDDDEERENIPPPPPAYVGGMALTTHQDSIAKMLLSMYFTANEALLEDACSHKTDAELSPPCGKAERTALAARKKAFLDSLPGKLGLDVIGGEEGQGRSGLVQVISVAPESLADFYGVRVEDTIVGINGYPLIRLSRAGFLDKVAKALTTCASGAPSGGVLRLFLVRKGKSPPLLTKAQISKSRASPSPSPPWEGNEVPAAAARPPRVKRARRPQTRPGGKDRKQHYKRWDEASPMDAVPQISVEAAAAAAAAAAQGRAERKELRKRPLWWDKRAKGSTLCVLRLRPAKAADRLDPARRVQEDQGSRGHVPGEPMLPGAFLSGALQIGAMGVPAGAQLVSVGNVCCRTVPFERVLQVATSAGKGEDIAFEVV